MFSKIPYSFALVLSFALVTSAQAQSKGDDVQMLRQIVSCKVVSSTGGNPAQLLTGYIGNANRDMTLSGARVFFDDASVPPEFEETDSAEGRGFVELDIKGANRNILLGAKVGIYESFYVEVSGRTGGFGHFKIETLNLEGEGPAQTVMTIRSPDGKDVLGTVSLSCN